MKLKKLGLLALTGFATAAIVSCGGGGGGGSVSTTASYSGAASQGDLATFTFDGKNLTYQISGPVFGNQTGTIQLTPVIPGESIVYKDQWDDYYYFSGNLGVAEIYLSDNDIATYVVGLKNVQTPDVTTVAGNSTTGKNYIYLEVSPDGSIDGDILTLKPDKTWQLSDGTNGTWKIVGNHIEAYDSNGNKVANVIIKPGQSRAGIIVDINPAFGGGFGIGLEQKPLTSDEITGTYQTYYYDPNTDVECFGKVTANGTTWTYTETWCSDGEPDQHVTGNITLNTVCGFNETVNGIACGGNYDIFIDPVDGYFIAINPQTGEEILGSSKPWNK